MLLLDHYVYIIIIFLIIILLILKKDIIFPCAAGLLIMGYIHTGSILKAIQTIYNGVIVSGTEFWNIIVIISFIYAMSKALSDINADKVMLNPLKKFIKDEKSAFFILGITMMLISFVLWPSPAVALVGAIMLPAAVDAGLPPIWAASAINIFGHGVALSGDFFIQGAPGITAKTSQLNNTFEIIKASLPLWLVMSISTIIILFFFMGKDLKNSKSVIKRKDKGKKVQINIYSKIVAVFTPIIFAVDIYIMYKLRLKGGDAAALISGTAIIIMTMSALFKNKSVFLEAVGNYIKDGFLFGIKTFSPVLVAAAFFFLGNEETSKMILGNDAGGYLNDIGLYMSSKINLNKSSVVVMQTAVSCVAGMGGAGFSALPLVGTLSKTFSELVMIDKAVLASLGQITAMWVGGGTIIPWGVIPAAAICNVEPVELVRKNFLPVILGIVITTIFSIFLL